MFEFASSPGPVRGEILEVMAAAWEHLARPGTWWDAGERRQIAETARAARARRDLPQVGLPPAAIETARFLASTPAHTTESWVSGMVEELGEEKYVEVLGIATRVVASDTFCRLLGSEPEPFLDPQPGRPSRERVDPRPKKIKSWIAVGNALVPPFTQALVPSENDATNALVETLYMTGEEMADPDFRRGDLHRTQIEMAASTLSYENECFY